MLKKLKWISIALIFPVLEVATMILVYCAIGIWLTLFLVFISSAIGLVLWGRWAKELNARVEENEKKYGKDVKDYPANVAFIHLRDAAGVMFAFLCFLSPGLLSDLLGFLAVSSKSFVNWYCKRCDSDLAEIAELHGITWGQYCEQLKKDTPNA